jgi:hypothetical protein
MHPYLIGVPHRIAGFDTAVAYIRARDRVWFAIGEEIVRHWLQIGRDLLTGRALFILLSTGGRELARFASQAIWSLRNASTGG